MLVRMTSTGLDGVGLGELPAPRAPNPFSPQILRSMKRLATDIGLTATQLTVAERIMADDFPMLFSAIENADRESMAAETVPVDRSRLPVTFSGGVASALFNGGGDRRGARAGS
jgi:hypothetical protein